MQNWVFWLQLIIIAFLLIFIIIRDKGVQKFFKNLIGWAKKKIRISKLKTKISNALDEKNKLIPELGKNYWDAKINNEIGGQIIHKLDLLKDKKSKVLSDLEEIKLQLKENKENKESKIKEHENIINSNNNEKKPLEIELKKLEKEFESVDKTIKEQKKLYLKIENNIKSNNKEKRKIKADPPGYSTDNEKNKKTKELDDKNNTLDDELNSINSKINDLRSENPVAKKRVEELTAKISSFNVNINSIKDEISIIKKEQNEENKKLETKNKQYTSDLILKKKEQEKAIKDLGHLLIEKRLDIPQLTNIYSQIDDIDKTVANLTKKLIKINKEENII